MIDLYDQVFFPDTRSKFIKSWINQSDSKAFGIIEDETLAGFGVIRKCRTGYKIGPLFANNSKLAESLFLALKASVEA